MTEQLVDGYRREWQRLLDRGNFRAAIEHLGVSSAEVAERSAGWMRGEPRMLADLEEAMPAEDADGGHEKETTG